MKKRIQGSVSVFLALILLPTYLLSIAGVDGARLYAGNNYLFLANEAGVESLKLNYDKDLRDNFNLYALDQPEDEEELEKMTKRVVKKNLTSNKEAYNKLQLIESELRLEEDKSLANPEILKNQIYDYMKYRLPTREIHSFINLIQASGETEKYGKVMEKRYAYNEELEKKDKDLKNLRQDLLTYSTDSKFVVDHFEAFMKEKEELRGEYKKKTALRKKLSQVTYDYSKWELEPLRKELLGLFDDEVKKKILTLSIFLEEKEKVEKKDGYHAKLEKKILEIKPILDKVLSINKVKIFEYNYRYGDREKDLIKELVNIDRERRKIIADYNGDLKAKAQKFLKEYESMSKRIKSLSKTSINVDRGLKRLTETTKDLSSKLGDWKKALEGVEDPHIKAELRSEFELKEKNYNPTEIYSFSRQLYKDRVKLGEMDARIFSPSGMLEGLKESYEKFFALEEDLLLEDMGILKINRPEGSKFFDNFFKDSEGLASNSEEDKNSKGLLDKLKEVNNKLNNKTEEKNSIFDYIGEEKYLEIMGKSQADFLTLSGDFANSKLENSSDLKNLYSSIKHPKYYKDRNTFLENIFISYYIDEKFSDKFVEVDGGTFPQKEYILFGSSKLDSNIHKLQASIFGMRLAANTVYAFTNPSIRSQALTLAVALAGWTGIGVPIMQGIIISLMAFAESGLDTHKLSEGKPVELYKNNSSWQISLTGLKNIAVENVKDLSKKSIDKVFDKGEDILQEARKGTFDSLNQFISQTKDSLVQRVSGSILVPVQNKIIEILSNGTQEVDKEFNDLFAQLRENSYMEEDSVLKKLRLDLISLLERDYKPNLTKMLKDRASTTTDQILTYIDEMMTRVEKGLLDQSGKADEELKEKIYSLSKSNSKKVSDQVNLAIDDYISRLSGTKEGNGGDNKSLQSIKSGLSFDYGDYLKLFTFLSLSAGNKEDILKRIGLIIDIEMNAINGPFNIQKAYTSFAINSKASINLTLDIFSDKKRKKIFEGDLKGAYDEF